MTRKVFAIVLGMASTAALSGCLGSELASTPPTARELGEKRAALAEAREALEQEHRRADASVSTIERTAAKEAAVDAEIAALNRQLLAFEQERAALSVLEREDRASSAQRDRVRRLEREIRVLKSLISETAR